MLSQLRPLILFALAGIAGCATQAPSGTVVPPPPAIIAPSPAVAEPFLTQSGIASFYGPAHDGKTTANGDTFDQRAFTAAHRTLAFGTVVRVTNLDNGRMVKVKINDRGPAITGRIIDLSSAAAHALEMEKKGVAQVKLEAYGVDQSEAYNRFRTSHMARMQ